MRFVSHCVNHAWTSWGPGVSSINTEISLQKEVVRRMAGRGIQGGRALSPSLIFDCLFSGEPSCGIGLMDGTTSYCKAQGNLHTNNKKCRAQLTTRDSGFQNEDSGLRTQNSGLRTQDSGLRTQEL